MVPLKRFLLNSSSLKDVNAPIVLGSVPRIPRYRDILYMLRKLPIDEGNAPFVPAPTEITSTLAKLADEVTESQETPEIEVLYKINKYRYRTYLTVRIIREISRSTLYTNINAQVMTTAQWITAVKCYTEYDTYHIACTSGQQIDASSHTLE